MNPGSTLSSELCTSGRQSGLWAISDLHYGVTGDLSVATCQQWALHDLVLRRGSALRAKARIDSWPCVLAVGRQQHVEAVAAVDSLDTASSAFSVHGRSVVRKLICCGQLAMLMRHVGAIRSQKSYGAGGVAERCT